MVGSFDRRAFSSRLLPELVTVDFTEWLGKLATGSARPSTGPGNCFPVIEHCSKVGYLGVAGAQRVPGTVVTVLPVGDSWNDIPNPTISSTSSHPWREGLGSQVVPLLNVINTVDGEPFLHRVACDEP